MPEITFILPHGIYWGGIFLVPAVFMLLGRLTPPRTRGAGISAALAYFLLAVGGMMGLHRLYLKSAWAVVFIALFVGVIYCNSEAKLARNEHSIARNVAAKLEYDIKRAYDYAEPDSVIDELKQQMGPAQANADDKAQVLQDWRDYARYTGYVIFALMLLDFFLLPRAVRSARRRAPPVQDDAAPAPPPESKRAGIGNDRFSRRVSAVNGFIGEFVSYWTIIAVFVFYYEVIARYIFNSPTIWAHEGMYLLFGMQYLLSGGFCLREGAHVRVDVLYMNLSPRWRAIADVVTSTFFFIFSAALVATGWIFFKDAFTIREVSFTEWAIAHYPIKFAIPLGGLLLMLQGITRLLHDIEVLRGTEKA